MRRHLPRLGALEYAAIAVLVAVVAYTGWVAWDVHASSSDSEAGASRPGTSTPSESSQVAAPEAPATPPSLDSFSVAASTARTILVIGDSTGAGPGEWVDLVAQDLGAHRRVSLHPWDETSGGFAEQPTSYGDAGRRLDIWNLSYQGVASDYSEHLDAVPQPDAVLVDIGHDRSPGSAEGAASATLDAVGQRWGDVSTALVLQNPSVGDQERQQRRTVRRLTGLAGEYADPVIDVYGAFEQAGSDVAVVTEDSRPTDAGSRLWADVVDRALGVTTSE